MAEENNKDEAAAGAGEEEVDIHVEPIVKLTAVSVDTGEQNEEEVLNMKAKMFRWGEGNAGLQWKERGAGDFRLLKHRETGLVRAVMRREKTLKLCANHILSEEMKLESTLGSDRAFVYNCYIDFSEDEPRPETLAIRFKDVELATKFKEAFEAARDSNVALKKQAGSAPATPARAAAAAADDVTPAATPAKEDEKKDAAVDAVAEKLETLAVEKKDDAAAPADATAAPAAAADKKEEEPAAEEKEEEPAAEEKKEGEAKDS